MPSTKLPVDQLQRGQLQRDASESVRFGQTFRDETIHWHALRWTTKSDAWYVLCVCGGINGGKYISHFTVTILHSCWYFRWNFATSKTVKTESANPDFRVRETIQYLLLLLLFTCIFHCHHPECTEFVFFFEKFKWRDLTAFGGHLFVAFKTRLYAVCRW